MVVMLSRVELRNRYNFENPFFASRYFVITYHFRGTNLYSTNVLHKYGNLVMARLGDSSVRKTNSGFLIEMRIPRYKASSIKEWNELMHQLEKDLNNIVIEQ
jgi:hypothetical protein